MTEKLLTISVAAYNVEKYIQENLNSMLIDDIMDDLEVFIIDDGGNDNTYSIAKDYESKYPDTFIAIHKENGGYGSTVNYSVKNARGKYFKILDGDDWFDKDGLVKLINWLKKNDSDVVVTNYYIGPQSGKMQQHIAHNEKHGVILNLKNYVPQKPIGMWSLVYKTEIIRESDLEMPCYTLYTDQIYSVVPFLRAKTICFLDYYVYCYRVGRDGQSVSRESRIKHIDEMLNVCIMLDAFIDSNSQSENYNYMLYRVAKYHATAIKTILLLPITKDNLTRLIGYDNQVCEISKDVYLTAEKTGKMGLLLKILRKTRYYLYWLIKLLPNGIPNWQ